MADYRVGIDVGGTFTDVVALTGNRLVRRKVRSSPSDFSAAVLQGLRLLLQEEEAAGDRVAEVIHGTTVASNAIIERKGAATGLLTTSGFRDVLEIGRLRTPRLYDLTWRKPAPLVERELRLEVGERVQTDGTVYEPLDEEDVRRTAKRLLDKGVESVAVCFINSFANPEHERRTGEILASMAPHLWISLSSQVLPELREYERTSTTVINAYILPVIDRYLGAVEKGLRTRRVGAPLMLMQSSGGVMSSALAREKPVHVVESGPAAGVMGALHMGRRCAHQNIISFDMGGTTAKAATIENGSISRHADYEVGGEMSMGHHLLRGDGYPLRLPSVELAEVGSGGGSIAWIDPGRVLQVGPHSAGADPGPACYAAGGTEPTVTDANVVLGYLNPHHLAGGELSLDAGASHRVMEECIARPLGIDATQAAYGIHLIVNSRMIRAINAVTREKGRDPGSFVLYAFGGCGPAHAVPIGQELGIEQIIVPPAPGVFSSLGLLVTDVEHHYTHTFWREAASLDCEEANKALEALEQEGYRTLHDEGYPPERIELRRHVDLRYVGQNFELGVPLKGERFTAESLDGLVEGFHQEHQRTFGYRSAERVQVVNLRLTATGVPAHPRLPGRMTTPPFAPPGASRRAYFGPEAGWLVTPVLGRAGLSASATEGPVIVEEYDATTVVPPGAWARLDEFGNIVVAIRRHS